MAKGNRPGGGGNWGGGQSEGSATIISTRSLVSDRERNQAAVDQVLAAARDIQEQYNVTATDLLIAKLSKSDDGVLAFHDAGGNVAINETYLNTTLMETAYKESVASGYHPSSGSKTAMEATTAHEFGHHIAYEIGLSKGAKEWDAVDKGSRRILQAAGKKLGYTNWTQIAGKISGYAKFNHKETVAEAVADVYCNGRGAKRESLAVVNAIHGLLK